MIDSQDIAGAALDRRGLLRLGGMAAAAAALPTGFGSAWAMPARRPPTTAHLAAAVERWVGAGKFPGIVASLGLPGREAEFVSRGTEGFTDADPVTPDSLFRIYSMTKPITGMAAMMLIAEGKLGLDQPLAEILPAFAHMQVQVTPDGSITDVRPARTAITIRNLLTHTAGLGYATIQQGPLRQAMIEKGVVAGRISRIPVPGLERGTPAPSLAAFADRLATLPLVYEPGTKWSYSLGLDLTGRVIEVVSGMPFDAFLQARLFDPLGMASTFFQVPAREAHRLTTNHTVVKGLLVAIDRGDNSIYLDKPAYPFGGSGLVSSPRDYDRFLRMLAGFGRLGRTRLMNENAVRIGTSNLLPAGVDLTGMMGPKGGFGAGGRVGLGEDAGVYGWAGAAGTVASVDMRRGIRTQTYAQFMPPNALPVLTELQQALRADIAALPSAKA
ncbi:MAG: serine hydrolase domain-containing protein [Novosphingobium sp.]